MCASEFDFWAEGRKASQHLQTLFWMGGHISGFVLRWRGKAYPEVGERFKASFQQLRLREEWIVEVGEGDAQGIRVLTLHRQAIELLPTFEQKVSANESLRFDQRFADNTLADFKHIMLWLQQFHDTAK